jgi:hypothetical protein
MVALAAGFLPLQEKTRLIERLGALPRGEGCDDADSG